MSSNSSICKVSKISHNPQMSQMWQRIKAARKAVDMTQAQLAVQCGVSRAAVSLWESPPHKGGSNPKVDNIKAISKITGAPFDWLVDDTTDLSPDWMERIKEEEREEASQDKYILIDYFDDIEHKGYLSFSEKWIEKKGYDVDSLIIFDVKASNMEPALQKGHIVLVDQSGLSIENDNIYAFKFDDTILFYRLTYSFDASIIISNDTPSPKHQDKQIYKDDIGTLPIIGRAVWTGGDI